MRKKKHPLTKIAEELGIQPEAPARPVNRLIIAGTMDQAKFRQRELLKEFGDLLSGNWVLATTTSAPDRLRGMRLLPGDLVEFYGTWEDGKYAEDVLRELRQMGWNGERMSKLMVEQRARRFAASKRDAIQLAREMHALSDAQSLTA